MKDERGDTLRQAAARSRGALALLAVLLPLLPPAAGCARRPRPAAERPSSLPLAAQVYADTGRGGRWNVRLPAARVWLTRVTPAPARPGQVPAPEPPEAAPESLPPWADTEPALEVDPGLKPPVPRAPAPACLGQVPVLPAGRAAAWVDLDVRVDEDGAVSEALRVAGSTDSSLVEAARRCALSMRFYPALRAGRAVAVWCRQRFDFSDARGAGR